MLNHSIDIEPLRPREPELNNLVVNRVRFFNRVQFMPNGCWHFIGHYDKDGYAKIGTRQSGKCSSIPAHRLAWIHIFGPIPNGLKVLHKCDNPPCCRPSHMFLGTQLENMQDKIKKGRDFYNPPIGLRHPKAKLTAELVREIRKTRLSIRKAAKVFGVSPGIIERVKSGISYRDVL